MIGITRTDKIKNHYVREKLGVAPISDRLRESRLRRYKHVLRKPVSRRLLEIEGRRQKGCLKLSWEEIIRRDLKELNLNDNIAYNRLEWKRRIHVADPI